jgi:hypothetical protein
MHGFVLTKRAIVGAFAARPLVLMAARVLWEAQGPLAYTAQVPEPRRWCRGGGPPARGRRGRALCAPALYLPRSRKRAMKLFVALG